MISASIFRRGTFIGLTLVALSEHGCATPAPPAISEGPTPAVARTGALVGGGAPGSVAVGRQLPDLTGHEIGSDTPFRLASLKGQVVLLDVWASWCAPCKEELPLLDEMAARLRGHGVQIVAVSIDDDRRAAQEFLRIKDRWSLRVVHDPEQKLAAVLAPPRMPSSYLVDRDGVLRVVHAGFERADAARIEAELIALAAGPAR